MTCEVTEEVRIGLLGKSAQLDDTSSKYFRVTSL